MKCQAGVYICVFHSTWKIFVLFNKKLRGKYVYIFTRILHLFFKFIAFQVIQIHRIHKEILTRLNSWKSNKLIYIPPKEYNFQNLQIWYFSCFVRLVVFFFILWIFHITLYIKRDWIFILISRCTMWTFH